MTDGALAPIRYQAPAALRRSPRAAVWVALTALLIGLSIAEAIVLHRQITSTPGAYVGMDYDFYRQIGLRWLSDGTYYHAYQLAGPYDIRLMVDVLYPPPALLLFIPLVWLPAVTWWLVPAVVIAYGLYRWRPSPFVWPLLLLLFMWPRAMGAVFAGNSDMWVAAGVAGALLWGWPAALVALKPTFLPLALLGIRRRGWWIALTVGLASIGVMAPLWADYVKVVGNVHFGWDYSIGSLPLAVLPLVACLGRSQSRRVSAPDGLPA